MKSLLTFLIVLSTLIYPQVTEEWVRTYNGYVSATVLASAVDQYGNVYITGEGGSSIPLSGSDYYTIKYNSEGVLLWEATYDGGIGNNDWGYCIALDPSGNVYVTGESKGIINGWDSGSDILTIKYDSQGNELWTQRYHGNNSFTTYNYDSPTAIAVDEMGNVYVTGQSIPTGNTTGFGSCVTIKYNTNGDLLWTARIGSDQGGFGADIKVDNNGNVYVLGMVPGSFPLPDLFTVKYNSSGEQQWIKQYNVGAIVPRAMDIDFLGNVYITSGDISPGIHTTKYNSAGDSLWTSVNALADPSDITVDAQGNVFVTGRAVNNGYTGQEYVTIKYNSSGQEQWAVRYDGLGDDRFISQAEAISLDSEGNIYVTGKSQGADFLQGDITDYATVKYSNNGVEQWAVRYHRPPDGTEWAIGIHNSSNGAVFVVGSGSYMTSSNTFPQIITIKYSQSPTSTSLIMNVPLGSQVLEVASTNGFSIGDVIVINPGGSTEETNTITGFGSMLLQTPLLYDHNAGEQVLLLVSTSVEDNDDVLVNEYSLYQNYPNPFNPTTKIRFVIPNEVRNIKDFSSQAPRNDNAFVTLKVYDVLGNEVATLVNEEKPAGVYEVEFNAAGLSSGIYFYKLQAVPSISSDQGFVETKKMMLLK